MDKIIGIGNAGCAICDEFSKYSQYQTYKLDYNLEKTDRTFPLQEFSNLESYENECPDASDFLSGITGEVLFVVGGGGKISLSSLRLLQVLSNCNINVLYIKPDLSFIGDERKKIDEMVFHVFQQYARSGVFNKLFLVDNLMMEKILPSLSIKNYYNKINEAIVSTLHMINMFNHIQAVNKTFYKPPEGVRIATFGFVDPKKNLDKVFFSLDSLSDVSYYYAYNKMKLETDGKLLAEIKNSIKRKTDQSIRSSYGIYETDYEEDYIYCVYQTSKIQGINEEIDFGDREELPDSP